MARSISTTRIVELLLNMVELLLRIACHFCCHPMEITQHGSSSARVASAAPVAGRRASQQASKQASKQPGAFPQHNVESSALTWPYTLARPCESWCLRSSISFFFRFSSARVSLRTPSLLAALPCTCCSSLPLPYTHKQRFLNPKLVQVFCHK